jgi:hypothetical protein
MVERTDLRVQTVRSSNNYTSRPGQEPWKFLPAPRLSSLVRTNFRIVSLPANWAAGLDALSESKATIDGTRRFVRGKRNPAAGVPRLLPNFVRCEQGALAPVSPLRCAPLSSHQLRCLVAIAAIAASDCWHWQLRDL